MRVLFTVKSVILSEKVGGNCSIVHFTIHILFALISLTSHVWCGSRTRLLTPLCSVSMFAIYMWTGLSVTLLDIELPINTQVLLR